MKNNGYFDKERMKSDNYKLICLPYAGGGGSVFYPFDEALPDSIDAIPICLPGREMRMAEDLKYSCGEVNEELAEELTPYLQSGNFSIFGHSMGGVIGYDLAKHLSAAGIEADVCFISATSIGEKFDGPPSLSLDDDGFIERVMLFGGLSADSEILKYPEFRKVFLRILRADFTIIESYEDDGIRLDCPIAAICGDRDPSETLGRMCSWEEHTSAGVIYKKMEGNHFYIGNRADELCSFLADTITMVKENKVINV